MRKRFLCSYDRIELVITYRCNMSCYNCDAMVPQAPSREMMTIDQIQRFISETIEKNVHWRHIRILGGEPTLHKKIFTILNLLLQYRDKYSPYTKIQLVTNGHGNAVQNILEKIPAGVEIENSKKTSNIQPTFSPVNEAPIDIDQHKDSDFSKGCWIPTLCGMTLDMHGYYPCSASAAIDRVFGFNRGRKELPVKGDNMESMFKDFCKLCGHFYDEINLYAPVDIVSQEDVNNFEIIHEQNFIKTQSKNNITKQTYSLTWDDELKKYRQKPPVLDNYGE